LKQTGIGSSRFGPDPPSPSADSQQEWASFGPDRQVFDWIDIENLTGSDQLEHS